MKSFLQMQTLEYYPGIWKLQKQLHTNTKAPKSRKLKTLHIGGAKNSNKRMLEIGKVLNKTNLTRAGMSLSLQTYTEEALKAIKRTNISSIKMIELQTLYKKNNLPSYCDLIINCPKETYKSF